jgi:hypothetical protein
MKTKMNKCGYVIVTAALLAMVVLVTSCLEGPLGYTPPAGMGSVQLNFNQAIQRETILPDGATTIDVFTGGIRLQFTAVSGGAVSSGNVDRTVATRNDPVNLAPGIYSLIVTGYVGASYTQAAATFSTGPGGNITVIEGVNAPYLVTLTAYDPSAGTESGKFSWSITNSVTGLTSATMTVTTLAGGATAIVGYDLLATGALVNSESLLEGYYYVDFTLITGAATRTFRQVLHVYRYFDSVFVYEFTNDHIGIQMGNFSTSMNFTPPKDNPPEWSVDTNDTVNDTVNGSGTYPSPYIMSLTGDDEPEDIIITITNGATFTDGIAWFLGSNPTPIGTSASYTFDDTDFTLAGVYQITVRGLIGTKPYAAEIYIKVIP